MEGFSKINIISNEPIGTNAWLMSLEYQPDFKPGQIISLTLNETIAPRLYSICSAPTDRYLDILYTVKPDGVLSPLLSKLKAGDEVFVSEPSGQFVMQNQKAWWIATGTGIAPFWSMFRSGFRPLKLIQGGRYIADLFFQSHFNGRIPYVACCSKESGDGIYAGRLSQYLQVQPQLPTDIYYYLCGSTEMVVDVRNLLIEKGIPFEQIIIEIYF